MTPKQERFVQEYLIDMNATQAAIRAGYSAHTAEQQGCRLCSNAKVAAAIRAAQVELRERTKVTVESLTEMLRASYELAKKNGQSASMVQASMGLAKLHGYLVDRTEDVTKVQDMTQAERTAELARIEAELDAIKNPAPAELEALDQPVKH